MMLPNIKIKKPRNRWGRVAFRVNIYASNAPSGVRYSDKFRRNVCKDYVDGLTLNTLCEKHKVSVPTIYNWLRAGYAGEFIK